ncbi:MAG: hypothetical protein JST00_09210 [Deltaproteobacteria bacterium]|nr:hypothetical protein [Deltaproteobacteria bacterium]
MGLALLGGGIAVTVTSEAVVWYGAIVVGLIQIARGAYALLRSPAPAPSDPADLDA